MSAIFIDRVYYRPTGTYPTGTVNLSSGWIKIGGAYSTLEGTVLLKGAKASIEAGNTKQKGNGNNFIESEKTNCEFELANASAADYAAIRTAFINKDVDVILVDSQNPTVGYLSYRVSLYPSGILEGGNSYKVTCKAEGEQSAGSQFVPHQFVTVSGVS